MIVEEETGTLWSFRINLRDQALELDMLDMYFINFIMFLFIFRSTTTSFPMPRLSLILSERPTPAPDQSSSKPGARETETRTTVRINDHLVGCRWVTLMTTLVRQARASGENLNYMTLALQARPSGEIPELLF